MPHPVRSELIFWLGGHVLPHEGAVRAWLGRVAPAEEADDLIQEAYCRIAALDSIDHVADGRAYFFTVVRNLLLQRVRRSRVVRIDAVAEIEEISAAIDEPSPERRAGARQELALVAQLIDALPDRCRSVFQLRKIQDLPQKEVARRLGISEHVVENEVANGLRRILRALAEHGVVEPPKTSKRRKDWHARNRRRD